MHTIESKVDKHINQFSSLLNQVRAIQEELLYASYYREQDEFNKLLVRLTETYGKVYDADEREE